MAKLMSEAEDDEKDEEDEEEEETESEESESEESEDEETETEDEDQSLEGQRNILQVCMDILYTRCCIISYLFLYFLLILCVSLYIFVEKS